MNAVQGTTIEAQTQRPRLYCRLCGTRVKEQATITLRKTERPAPICPCCYLQLTSPERDTVLGL